MSYFNSSTMFHYFLCFHLSKITSRFHQKLQTYSKKPTGGRTPTSFSGGMAFKDVDCLPTVDEGENA